MRLWLRFRIRKHLREYVDHRISLGQFRDWFDLETWDIIDKVPRATQELAGAIELRLAEFTSGHLTEDELRALFSSLL